MSLLEKIAQALHEERWPYVVFGEDENCTRLSMRDARTALSVMAEEQSSKWQPIETAPKDGTWVLLYFAGWDKPDVYEGQPTIFCGQWVTEDHWRTSDRWYVDWGDLTQYHIGPPTHWMPVPEPPK